MPASMPEPDEPPEIRLIGLDGPELVEPTRAILREYAESLSIDLRFQNFEYELASLPGDYAPPQGRMLLAFVGDALAGCGALRPVLEADYANACEMKRLYVRPAFRRFGLGRALAQALLDEARGAGYSVMLLDTLDDSISQARSQPTPCTEWGLSSKLGRVV